MLRLPFEEFFSDRVFSDKCVGAKHDQKSANLRLKHNDKRKHTHTNKLLKDGPQQFHIKYSCAKPPECVDPNDADKNAHGRASFQQFVHFIKQECYHQHIKYVKPAYLKKTDMEESYQQENFKQ